MTTRPAVLASRGWVCKSSLRFLPKCTIHTVSDYSIDKPDQNLSAHHDYAYVKSGDMDEEFNSHAAGQILRIYRYCGLLFEIAGALSLALGNSYRWSGKMIPGWDLEALGKKGNSVKSDTGKDRA